MPSFHLNMPVLTDNGTYVTVNLRQIPRIEKTFVRKTACQANKQVNNKPESTLSEKGTSKIANLVKITFDPKKHLQAHRT